MRRRSILSLLLTLGLLLTSCSADPTTSDEYQDLDQQLADTEQELADVTAERDALAATASESSDRYERSLATQEAVEDILHNPESYGTEEEVVELLATYATEDAVMDDEVFGAVPIRNAWYFTLYSGTMDAEIDNYYRWLSDDGSQGGALWLWHGNNTAGNPFELAGIALDEYDENGLIKYEYVVYPYPDDYVRNAKDGSGTAQSAEEVSSDDMFVFGEDDLCEWITEDAVAEAVSAAFDSMGEDWDGVAAVDEERSGDDGCVWVLTNESAPAGGEGSVIWTRSVIWMGPYTASNPPEETIDYAGDDPEAKLREDVWTTGYPGLSDGVAVKEDVLGTYALWVEDADNATSVSVGHPDAFDGAIQPMLIFADRILRELNWTG